MAGWRQPIERARGDAERAAPGLIGGSRTMPALRRTRVESTTQRKDRIMAGLDGPTLQAVVPAWRCLPDTTTCAVNG